MLKDIYILCLNKCLNIYICTHLFKCKTFTPIFIYILYMTSTNSDAGLNILTEQKVRYT
jgi:hypothetical protein